jgi:glycosyltransferase 2 family protein
MGQVRVRRQSDLAAAAGGLVVLGLGMLAVRDSSVSDLEESAFRAVNDLPGFLYPVLWPFSQLGVIVVGPIVAVIALVLRKWWLALAALLATAAKLSGERVVKAMVSRQRPGTSVGDIHARGDVSLQGESFVSGHAVLAGALACLIAPYLRGRWRLVPWVGLAFVMIGRVYVGAHNPLDVICGAGLGVAIGSVLNLAIGVPAPEGDDVSRDRRRAAAR